MNNPPEKKEYKELDFNRILQYAVEDYLGEIDKENPPAPDDVGHRITQITQMYTTAYNAVIKGAGKELPLPTTMHPIQVAAILIELHHAKVIHLNESSSEEAGNPIGIYQKYNKDTQNGGIYDKSESTLKKLIRAYNKSANAMFKNEVMDTIMDIAPCVIRNTDPDLVAVKNGIFNYRTKQLIPFSPDYIFLHKSPVAYNPNAKNVTIHNDEDGTDWDVESWIAELSDDPEIVNLIWELFTAVLRPMYNWKKSAWFYSEKGNNGKGTLCQLMRNLCGTEYSINLPLSDMSKQFSLEQLITKTTIITDENSVGTFLEKNDILKAIITHDMIQIDRKFKPIITYRFKGFMVQCINELPKSRDKTGSLYRRQLFIPFDKCFTGIERSYIKEKYIAREDVLEYVLYKALNTNIYELSTPRASLDLLETYKLANDPIRQFTDEILPRCQWDLLPAQFLYDLYRAWYGKNVSGTGWVSKNQFLNQIRQVLENSPDWESDTRIVVKTKNLISVPEPLIEEYNLETWYGEQNSRDPKRRLIPRNLASTYKGLLRKHKSTQDQTENSKKEAQDN